MVPWLCVGSAANLAMSEVSSISNDELQKEPKDGSRHLWPDLSSGGTHSVFSQCAVYQCREAAGVFLMVGRERGL